MNRTRKWEYKTIEIKSKMFSTSILPNLDEQLNELGRKGWELVTAGHNAGGFGWYFFLKRPIS